jgi:hypothetical protein
MGAAVEWAESSLVWVIQEHCEKVMKVHQEEEEEEENRSSAVKPVDVSRSASILSVERRMGHYAGPEESKSWVRSVGWKEG